MDRPPIDDREGRLRTRHRVDSRPQDCGDDSCGCLQLEQRVIDRVDRDGVSFAVLAEVKVFTRLVHALNSSCQ